MEPVTPAASAIKEEEEEEEEEGKKEEKISAAILDQAFAAAHRDGGRDVRPW